MNDTTNVIKIIVENNYRLTERKIKIDSTVCSNGKLSIHYTSDIIFYRCFL